MKRMQNSLFLALGVVFAMETTQPASADSAAELRRSGRSALQLLYANNSTARAIGRQAVAVLVFPQVTEAGFIVGAHRGDGVLFVGGKTSGYYNTTAGSWGLQAGAQQFGYAMFFMNSRALRYLRASEGWEAGGTGDVVVVDEGIAKTLSTTTARKGIYAFFFNQKGFMGGLTLQGTKITKYTPSE
jgi:lipid-binding SYLF domain-containing protein